MRNNFVKFIQKVNDKIQIYILDYILDFFLRKRNFNLIKNIYYKKFSAIPDAEILIKIATKFLKSKEKIDSLTYLYTLFHTILLNYAKKNWKNEDITGKKLLIYCNHGLGDTFLMCRYLHIIDKTNVNVILQVPYPQIKILQYNFPSIKVTNNITAIDENEYDYTTSIMTLLYNLKLNLKNIPFSSGYLKVKEEDINKFKQNKDFQTSMLKVGLVIEGSIGHNTYRFIPVKKLSNLFCITDIKFYFFKLSILDYLKIQNSVRCNKYINDLYDTACILKNIDCLVTIDTSIAHLAGALGIKTYLLLPKYSDWRWFNDTNKTAWYDSIEIIKQTKKDDWDSVLNILSDKLTLLKTQNS